MGYYNRIGFIKKSDYRKIKSLTPVELCNHFNEKIEDGHVSLNSVITELHNLGQGVDYEPTKGLMFKFFTKKSTREFMGDDEELYRVNKEFFEFIIEDYRTKVAKNYNDMASVFMNSEFLKSANYDINLNSYEDDYSFDFSKITQEETNALYRMITHIRSTHREWRLRAPFDFEKGDEVTTSHKYEYAIFELLRIYKSFDWKKNILVYYGG